MGRRALKKIDPELDLSSHLLTWEDIDSSCDSPWDPVALFGRVAPLEIEVGSGKGLFLASAAAVVPDHDYFGIEVSRKYARFAAARLANQSSSNAKMLHGDALRFFRERVPDHSLAAVHVYFPDPWWKKRHRRRRVMTEPFADDVQRTLRPGGELHFWTDVEEYFAETVELLARTTQLVGPNDVPVRSPEHDLDYRTHFERRTRLHGLPVYRATYCKPEPDAGL